MFFDLIANRKDFLKLSDEQVNSALCSIFPERKLYSHSIDWRKSDEYILKARGTGGDVIVGWEREVEKHEPIRPLRCRSHQSILDHGSQKRKGNSGSSRDRK
jgi:hypothetical protein